MLFLIIETMEGCLYKENDDYYLITNIANYNILVLNFETLTTKFISKDNFKYDIVDYNTNNIKMLLDVYEEFKDNIDYSNLKDFNHIIYNDRVYYIRSWIDVFDFAAGHI